MKPKNFQVECISEGSDNPEISWAKDRFCFMKELAIKFGQLDPTTVSDPTYIDFNIATNVPEIFPSTVFSYNSDSDSNFEPESSNSGSCASED